MKAYRSFMAILLVALTLFGLAACGGQPAETQAPEETTVPTTTAAEEEKLQFPEGTQILGATVGGMEPQVALETVNSVLSAYGIAVTVNDKHFTITGEAVLLTVTLEDITAYAEALQKGNTTAKSPEPKLDAGLLRDRIAAGTGSSVVDAKVVYNKSKQTFEITKEKSGVSVDTYEAAKVIEPAMLKLEPSASVSVQVQEMEPTVKSDDPRLKAAAEKANGYLKISLTYVYAPEKVEARSQALTKNEIGGMIAFDGSMKPYINSGAVNNYAIAMNDKYCVRDKSQSGGYLGVVLQSVNVQALAADIKSCLEKGTSGTRNAPYNPRVEPGQAVGESYVEVNLTAQHLYVYKNGTCVVSTPIVSGCVANGTHTIRGEFKIYAKTRNVTLTGPGYASPVKYWMPFSGGYGLHDANWRSEFGGEQYLYNGSHGCVNIPPSVAGQVYDNISIGTKVIIYGGANSVKERPQNLTAKTDYKLTPEAAPFDLNVAFLGAPTLKYTSSNPAVATVSNDGKVTVKGVGKTTITVDAPKHGNYLAGSLTITITVAYDCSKGHDLKWETTKEATCQPGEQVGTCKCSHTETKVIDPVKEHEYTWVETKAPTCADGLKTGTCAGCGNVITEVLPAIQDHSYSEFVTTQAPTCNAEGVQSSTCSGCGDVKTQTLPKNDEHAFVPENEFCGNGCGAANPGYVPPAPEPSEPSDSTEPGDSTEPSDSTEP